MTLHEYLQGMKGKTAAVIGLGVSNRPLVELLARNGVKVIACFNTCVGLIASVGEYLSATEPPPAFPCFIRS